ncbi:MAG: DUF4406 domain-containing protein [Gordonibacter pamelaeae]
MSGPVCGHAQRQPPRVERRPRMRCAPGLHTRIPHGDVEPGHPWTPAMKLALMAILAQADGLAMLEGWSAAGARALENTIALALGMPVMDVDELMAEAGGRR